jgi:hypothetical protein
MKVKLFTSLFVLLLYIGTTFGQQKVFEGKESTYKNH